MIHGAVQTVDTSLPAKDMLQVLVAQNRGQFVCFACGSECCHVGFIRKFYFDGWQE